MTVITSREHPIIKQLVKLEKSAQFRKKNGLTILDGPHLVQSYYAAFGAPISLVINESSKNKPEIKQLTELISHQPDTELYQVSDALFRLTSPVKTPSGILAIISKPAPETQATQQYSFCVLLEAIQDPGNLGSILRSAAAANVNAVYLSYDCVNAWSPKVLRAAMGAHFALNIHENCQLQEIIQQFNGKVISTTLGAKKTLYQTALTGRLAFIFGNEGQGVSESITLATQEKVVIPMPGKTESLNVAAAAAICLFEKVRQESICR